MPIPIAARSKAWFAAVRCYELRVRIQPGAWMPDCSDYWCACRVEVSASDWSLVQRSPTGCGVFECDCETSIMRRPWSTRGCWPMKKIVIDEQNILMLISELFLRTLQHFLCIYCTMSCVWYLVHSARYSESGILVESFRLQYKS